MSDVFRIETDSLGSKRVPNSALFGIQTLRAVENFPISGRSMPWELLECLVRLKRAAAQVNKRLGLLSPSLADAICVAATEVIDGKHRDQFPVDVFQTGSGTSTNMNVNEVLANRAAEILGQAKGEKFVHPNDHVNLGQSSNDVIPSALHVAALRSLRAELLPALQRLEDSLRRKAVAFYPVVKLGRTHHQDAVPMRLGDEFGAFAEQIRGDIRRITACEASLSELALGGTAVGTGINAHPGFAKQVISEIAQELDLPFKAATNYFEALSSRGAAVEVSGQLKTCAVSLMKIANDIRLLGSGPQAGLGELELPSLQPGSSIMPGKVNPVLVEVMCMVSAQVIGNDVAITIAGQSGTLQLNVMVPLIADRLLESIRLISNVAQRFASHCIDGLVPRRETCRAYAEGSAALATALVPALGYDEATKLAQAAHESRRSVAEVLGDVELSPERRAELRELLDVEKLSEAHTFD